VVLELRATIDTPLVALVRRPVGGAVLLPFVAIVTIRERNLDIFQRQLHLIAIKPSDLWPNWARSSCFNR
jgi:hypothetical protein